MDAQSYNAALAELRTVRDEIKKARAALTKLETDRDQSIAQLASYGKAKADRIAPAAGLSVADVTGTTPRTLERDVPPDAEIIGFDDEMNAPLGGAQVDRLRRRPLLIVLNLISVVLVLPLLLVHDRHGVWICYLVMTLYGLASGVTGSAMTAFTQTLIPPQHLGDANGLLQTLLQGLRLIAPLLGAGVLSAFGLGLLVAGDAATFALAALLIALIRQREDRPQSARPEETGAEIGAGFRYIARTPALRQFTVAVVLAVVAFGLCESVLFAVVDTGLRRPPAFLGVLGSLQGAGAIAAGVVTAVLLRRAGERRTVVLGLACAGAGFLLSAAPYLLAVAPGAVLIGASLPLIVAGAMTLFQRRTPTSLMGRTGAALNVLIGVPQTAAIAAGAGLIALVDYRVILAVMGALMAASALYLATRTTHQSIEAVATARRAQEPCEETPTTAAPHCG
ncbi:MFS transporter [Streptomyces collinus]|uniref:Major facilitator transporter n=1 Tax=Streptomyces collinus (strain DSM 40733 / Tue 365) TaxID=1214242 RepID=S5VF48_STRC3|nr:MFS transporter [Streptomyces collinus]AGS66855.1 major facilitator transporter [Streptomyces collinus Tu 365]AGS73839.1 major facilitator transporter [Streptomyces collinus Tu 365]